VNAEPFDEVAHLRLALEHRTTIGIALGILMERYAINEDQAFAYLKRVSNESETRLFEVAKQLVETGHTSEAGHNKAPAN
jgi:AmiR/NasT family two-component response regulator